MIPTRMTRRDFMRLIGHSGIILASQPLLNACNAYVDREPSEALPGDPDVEIRLVAKPDVQQIFPGSPTNIWRYQGEVIQGSPNSLTQIENSYLGPIFNIKTGTHLRVHFENELPEKSIVHWHGLHVPDSADGHPRFSVDSGNTYIYDFEVMDRAGTYWYHPHPHGRTGPQVYRGMAGLFLIHDEHEAALSLPSDHSDLPLVIQDRQFDDNNQLVYNTTGMMDQMVGFLGNQILVNGKPEFSFSADRRAYRLRLMNGSNSRIYKLAWEDATSLNVIGTEGGLLETPLIRDYITFAPAQRIDLWVDFGQWEPNTTARMIHLPASLPGGRQQFPIFTVDIQNTDREMTALPENFPPHDELTIEQAVNTQNPRSFSLQQGMGMRWTINGRTFDMLDVAREESVVLDEVEIWEFINQISGGMGMSGMSQPHPMHIHGLQFKILERQLESDVLSSYDSVSHGFVDEGWHDTVLVMPGERVKLLMRFEDFPGLYLYHCHNLEHEDMGMMRNYQIREG